MKAEFGLPVVSPDIHTQLFDMAKLKRAFIIGYTDTFTTNSNQKYKMYRPGCSKYLPNSLRKISNLKFLDI